MIKIANYSAWNLIIYGETKELKDFFLGLEAKYNPHLKNPESPDFPNNDKLEERVKGFIFPNKWRGRLVSALITNDIEYVDNTEKKSKFNK